MKTITKTDNVEYIDISKAKVIPQDTTLYAFSDGRIYSTKTNKFLKVSISNSNSYAHVYARINGKFKKTRAHRLIATAFFGEIKRGIVVNHKDGNRSNNHIENLELITQRENIFHGKDLEKDKLIRELRNEILELKQKLFGASDE